MLITYLELRRKIEQQLAQLPPDKLSLLSDFLDALQTRENKSDRPLRRIAPIKRGSKAVDLLKFGGTWQGNDLEECLQFVRETRSKAQF